MKVLQQYSSTGNNTVAAGSNSSSCSRSICWRMGVKMQVALVLLLAGWAVGIAPAAAITARNSRSRTLLQSGVSCPAQIPGCRPRRCTTRILGSQEAFVCLRCLPSYIPVKGSDGKSVVQCVCPAGSTQVLNSTTSIRTCRSCSVGSYCPGGDLKARLPTDNIGGREMGCNRPGSQGLTTKSEKSTRAADCVAQAGYVLPLNQGDAALRCNGSSYAPAFNRLRGACLPCQSGLKKPTWFTGVQENKLEVCQVPPGKFWELNVVRDCPKGLYREDFVRTDNKSAISCNSCPQGWTTDSIGSELLSKCNVLLPGYKVSDVPAGKPSIISMALPGDNNFMPYAAEPCPIGFYYDGSSPTLGCEQCPFGSTTLKNASTSINDCLVPPGFYINNNTRSMEMCPTTAPNTTSDGYYRSGWQSFTEAVGSDGRQVCTPCGVGILSTARDADERPGAPDDSLVPASPASCYILPGWGITFNPQDMTRLKAVAPCGINMYGVASVTYGLSVAPCKACPANLHSPEGSTSYKDCKNPGGFGYTSEGANQCPQGFYAQLGQMEPCEQCPAGKTTLYQPGVGTYQDSIEDCFPEEGKGLFSSDAANPWAPGNATSLAAAPCPVGCFGQAADSTAPATVCQACPGHSSTKAPGSSVCDACAPGYGKAGSSRSCAKCHFGAYHIGGSDTCSACPFTTFNDPVGDGYTSYGITFKTGVQSPTSCVPRYSQLPKPAGDRLALPDDMFGFTQDVSGAVSDNAAVKACIELCPADKCCIAEMAKDSGFTGIITCKHARLTPVAASTSDGVAKLFYKLPPSEIAAASVGTDKQQGIAAKTMGAGIFAVCNINAWAADAAAGLVGTSPNPALVEAGRTAIEWNTETCKDLDSCKQACMANAPCWGFIWHPAADAGRPGYALRGGESFLGGRTFFVSPDGKQSTVDVAALWDEAVSGADIPSICPAASPSDTSADTNSTGGGGATLQDAGPVPVPQEGAPVLLQGCSGDPPAALIPGAVWGCAGTTASGKQCTANSCSAGFVASGSLSAECTDGAWGSPLGSCIAASCSSNPLQELIPNAEWDCGSSTASGDSCNAACTAGFVASGPVTATCTNGVWGAAAGKCTPAPCTGSPPATLIPNTAWSCGSSTASGDSCSAACTAGFVASGPVTATCTNGAWAASAGKCTPAPCTGSPPATLIPNTAWSCGSSTASGDSCSAACTAGFVASGPVTATCTNGVWGAAAGQCTPAPCTGNPPATLIPNAQWSCSSSTASGTSCTSTSCSGIFAAEGTLSATCRNGVWDSQSGTCIVGSFCPNVPAPSSTCYARIRPKVYPIVMTGANATNTVINLAEVMLFDASGAQVPQSLINMTTSTQLRWTNSWTKPGEFLLLNASYCNDGNGSTVQLTNYTATNITTNTGPGQLCHTATAPYNGFWDPCPLLSAAYPCSVGRLSRVVVWNRVNTPLSPCSGSCKSRIDNFNLDVVMNSQLVTTFSFANGTNTDVFNISVPIA